MTIWAIEPRALADVAERERSVSSETMADLLAGRIAQPQAAGLFGAEKEGERERCYRLLDDGTAVVRLAGPLYPDTASWWKVWLTNGTTYGTVLEHLREALADPFTKRVVIEVDSPGGQVAGVVEAAAALRALKGPKPIEAHGVGQICSAAYWFVSQCDRITASPVAPVGNLGIVVKLTDDTEALKMEGLKRFTVVNVDSPRKRPDLDAPDGLADYQAEVDAIFDAFVKDVAEGRGVDDKWVRESMGRGASLVGQAAVDAKLLDELSVGIPPMAAEDGSVETSVLFSVPGSLPASATHREVPPMAHTNATPEAAGKPTAADPRDQRIAELTAENQRLAAERDAAKEGNAQVLQRLKDLEQAAADKAKAERTAEIKAIVARNIEVVGNIAPDSRERWEARGELMGPKALAEALADIPAGAARPVELRGGSNPTGPQGAGAPADMQDLADLATKAVAEKKYTDFPTAMRELGKLYPQATKVLRAGGER